MMSSRWRRRGGWSAPAWARPTTGCRGEPFLFHHPHMFEWCWICLHFCITTAIEIVCLSRKYTPPYHLSFVIMFLTSGSEKSCEDCKHSHRSGRQTFQSRRQFENCGGAVLVLRDQSSEKAMLRLETWCWLWQWKLWQGGSDGIWQHYSCPSILQRVDYGCAWQSCSKKVNELTPSYCKWPIRDAPLYQSCSFFNIVQNAFDPPPTLRIVWIE